jgi:hypothetical protein
VSWRLANVLHLIDKRRDWSTPGRHTKSAPADDGLLSIVGPLFQEERVELERLFREIDQFSETFKTSARKQYNR